MKLGSSDDLRKLFHVCRLDVDDVETLVLDVQIPQVDSQIVARDERLPIRVNGYAVDVIGMSIGVGPSRDSSDNSIMVGQSG